MPTSAAPARIAAALALLLSACSTAHYGSDRIAQKDPLEKVNRKVYKFDRALDKAVLRPVAKGYVNAVPEAGRRGISNFFNNVEEPRNFVNAVLQGKPKVAARTLGRFVINTVLGVGGFADHATGMGLPAHKEDLGQTLAVWGVGTGPYLVLPLLGPSTLRDGLARGAELAGADPYALGVRELDLQWYLDIPLSGIQLVDARAELLDTADRLLNGSADEYAVVKSAYLQERRNEIYDGNPPDDDDATPPAPPADRQPTNPSAGGSAQDHVVKPPAATEALPAPAPRADTPPPK